MLRENWDETGKGAWVALTENSVGLLRLLYFSLTRLPFFIFLSCHLTAPSFRTIFNETTLFRILLVAILADSVFIKHFDVRYETRIVNTFAFYVRCSSFKRPFLHPEFHVGPIHARGSWFVTGRTVSTGVVDHRRRQQLRRWRTVRWRATLFSIDFEVHNDGRDDHTITQIHRHANKEPCFTYCRPFDRASLNDG